MKTSLKSTTSDGAQYQRFVMLTIRAADGVTPEAAYGIRDALNFNDPEGWWFLNPGTFIVYFLVERKGAERAAECREAIERLRSSHESLGNLSIRQAEGEALAQFGAHGHLSSIPIGGAFSQTESQDG